MLSVCATPIGNLEDVTLRVLRELAEADVVLCEDTRRTRGLLERHGIRAKLLSYHEHNEAARTAELLPRLVAGERIALVSDAGLPVISDPGARLVAAALEAGVPPLPEDVQQELREFTPVAGTSIRNPLDVMSIFSTDQFVTTMRLAAKPDVINVVLFHTSFSWGGRGDADARVQDTVQNLVRAREAAAKPIAVSIKPTLDEEGAHQAATFAAACAGALTSKALRTRPSSVTSAAGPTR